MTRDGRRLSETARRGPNYFFRAAALPAALEPLTPVVFQGTGECIVTGPESGQVYCFSSHDPQQMVDIRDAEALLKTGMFGTEGQTRAWGTGTR